MSTALDIADFDKRARLIFNKVDEAGWAAWTEAGEDDDHCTVRIGPSADEPFVVTEWARDPATGRIDLVGAEGDGRDLPTIAAVTSFLLEEMKLD